MDESNIKKRKEVLDKIEKAITDAGYSLNIDKKSRACFLGESDTKGVGPGGVNSLCLSGFGKENYENAYKVISDVLKNQDDFKITKDNYFTMFLQVKSKSNFFVVESSHDTQPKSVQCIAQKFDTVNRNERIYSSNMSDNIFFQIMSESGKDFKNPRIRKEYGIRKDGRYNACVVIDGFNKPLRGRSELVIIKGDSILLTLKADKKYSLPGGSWEENEDHMVSAIREAKEEVRVLTKNVKYVGKYVEAFDTPVKWVRENFDKSEWWYGYYTEVYVGEYNGKYNGNIDDVDMDDLINTSKFYKIDNVYELLKPIHKQAVDMYIKESVTTTTTNDIIYHNFEDFESGECNFCFVTGLSGSGKSTLAKQMAKKYNAEYIELDMFHFALYKKDPRTMSSPVFYEYLKKHKDVWEIFKDKEKRQALSGTELGNYLADFIEYTVEYAKKRHNKKFIIEGVQIFSLRNPARFEKYPLVIINRSIVRSYIQRLGREIDEPEDVIKQIKRSPKTIKFYIEDEKNLNDFIKYFTEDVLLESKYNSIIPEDIIKFNKELNSYDYGFMYKGDKLTGKNLDYDLYKTLSISEFEKYKIGTCYDYTHYEAKWFKDHKYKHDTYYIETEDKDGDHPSHTFLVFYLPNSSKVYYFESAWGKYRGIEKFDSINGLLNTILDRHKSSYKIKTNSHIISKYNAISTSYEHIGYAEFMKKASANKSSVDMYTKSMTESCKNVDEARKFLMEVDNIAKKYDANYYIVTDGASKTSNKGNPAVRHAREEMKKWEKNHGYNPDEDWGDTMKESGEDDYYRVTYNGIGIYDAYKHSVSVDEWRDFLSSNACKWLPKPKEYQNTNRSYFTKKGYEKFKSKTLPEFYRKLDKNKVKVDRISRLDNIIYSDEYQVVVEMVDDDSNFPRYLLEFLEEMDEGVSDEYLLMHSMMEASGNPSYIIRDAIYPIVERTLSTPQGDRKFRDLVRKFIDKNSSKLHTSGPVYLVPFTDADKEDFFRLFGTTKKELTTPIVEMTKMVNDKASWKLLRQNPIFCLFYECIRYYTLTNNNSGVNVALAIYALSVYPSVFSNLFQYGTNPDIMQYTIDNLTAKYIIKQEGNVFSTLMVSIQNSYRFLRDGFKESPDAEIIRFVARIRNDQKSLFKNIANNYYDNYKKGIRVKTQSETYGDNELVDDNLNNTSVVEDTTRKIVLSIITNGVDMTRATAAAKIAGISTSDLHFYLSKIIVEDRSTELQKFIEAILFVFLYQEKHKPNEINERRFLQFAIELFRKTNTQDVNIVTIKDLLQKWSDDVGINERFKRLASQINYKRGIYFYVILCIQYYNA